MTSSQHNSDERDLLDFADAVAAGQNPQPRTDEERTYLHVHNAMQGDSAAIPSTTKQSTWEHVMSTLALTPEAPVSNRTRKQQGLSSPPPRSARPKRMQWTPLASIAAAVLVIVASFGVWHINQTPTEPPLAPQMAGITSGDDVALSAATPEATAVEDETGTRSIPIVQMVDEQPMDGPVIWLTNSGDVMYDDGTEVTTIATDVLSVMAGMPNVIQLVSEGDESTDKAGNATGSWVTTYYNLLTGETLIDDGTFSSRLGNPNMYGPLTVLTIADAPNEWSVVNFETMESISISELTGGQFPSSESITAIVNEDHSAIAIATSQYESEGSATLLRQSGLPGEVAVIPADLSGVSWVAVPEDMPQVGNISLSPDGKSLALISAPFNQEGASTTISVIDVVSGDELVRTEPMTYKPNSFFQWVEGGDAFIAVNGAAIQRYTLEGSEPTVLLETEGSITLMPRMEVDNVVHVETRIGEGETATIQFLIINTATGETITMDGEPWFLGLSGGPEQFNIPLAPVPVKQEDGSRKLVHPVSGEEFGSLAENDAGTPVASDIMILEATRLPVASAAQAPVSVIRVSDRTIQVFTTTENGFDVEEFELPGDNDVTKLYLSQDGRYLIAGSVPGGVVETDSGWAILDLNNPDAGWSQDGEGQMLTFVEIRED